jgi:hypothetical protein
MTPTLHQISTRSKRTNTANLNGSESVADKAPGGRKRIHDTEDTVESESVPAKKTKVVIKSRDIQSVVRRSGRSPKPNGKAITQKRKRRTKAEVEAAKATAEAAKMQKEKTAQDAKQHLAQMDIDDDVDKAQTAANTIRRLSDVAMNSATDLDGEEFVGFNDVSSTSDKSDDDEDLKVRQINFCLKLITYHYRRPRQYRRTIESFRNSWKSCSRR